MKTWFTITNKAEAPAAEIDIFDEIGLWGVTAKDFALALKSVPRDREINLRINSPGGSVWDGFTIYNLLAERRDKVTARVIGLAASMASVIMLAAKRTESASNATIMIHNPAAMVAGESEEMRKIADLLDKLRGQLANVYGAKTGKPEAEIIAAMDATTWFTGEEAKEWGLVDAITEPVQIAASFDLTRFGAVPANISGGQSASINTQPKKEPSNMKNLIKALVEAKLIASTDVSEDTAVAQFAAAFSAVSTANTDLKAQNDELTEKLKTANGQIAASLKATAENAVAAAVTAGRLKDDKDVRAKWVDAYVRDEAGTKAMLDSLPEAKAPRGVPPVATSPAADPKGSKPEIKGIDRVAAAFKADPTNPAVANRN